MTENAPEIIKEVRKTSDAQIIKTVGLAVMVFFAALYFRSDSKKDSAYETTIQRMSAENEKLIRRVEKLEKVVDDENAKDNLEGIRQDSVNAVLKRVEQKLTK